MIPTDPGVWLATLALGAMVGLASLCIYYIYKITERAIGANDEDES